MYSLNPPWIYRKFLSKAVFRMPDDKVYLTFDDGPDPDVTTQVLDLLAEEQIPATFLFLERTLNDIRINYSDQQ